MRKTKIAITLDEQFVEDIDRLVREHVFQNRSQAIQEAVEEKLKRLKRTRLATEWREEWCSIAMRSPFSWRRCHRQRCIRH